MASPYEFVCERCGKLTKCSREVPDTICIDCELDMLPEMTLEEYEKVKK